MAECSACGARYSPGEHFCGNCGAQLIPNASELKTLSATLGDEVDVQPMTSAQLAITLEDAETRETPVGEDEPQVDEEPGAAKSDSFHETSAAVAAEPAPEPPRPISSDSLGGSYTDNIPPPPTSSASQHRGTTGGHQPTVKQLAANTVLNGRYEIVRRIGGGGMGAVYLAKDRNLGDAPRAVKEMIESHLDPSQHEKAIGDFKRESLLLTSLEHPSIPTIYDYFYDEPRSRFYLVMKYISGGDLASRMRAAIGGRLD